MHRQLDQVLSDPPVSPQISGTNTRISFYLLLSHLSNQMPAGGFGFGKHATLIKYLAIFVNGKVWSYDGINIKLFGVNLGWAFVSRIHGHGK